MTVPLYQQDGYAPENRRNCHVTQICDVSYERCFDGEGRKIGADSRIVAPEQIELQAIRNATQREP
jgi:hypothetical protein